MRFKNFHPAGQLKQKRRLSAKSVAAAIIISTLQALAASARRPTDEKHKAREELD